MLRITIARSRTLLVYLIIVHSLMLITLLSLLGRTGWSLLVTLLLGLSFIYYAQQHQWLKAKKSLISIERHADKEWLLNYFDGSQKLGLRLSSSFVTPQIVILYFNSRYFWQCESVTVMQDAVDSELFRELRVHLRSSKTYPQ